MLVGQNLIVAVLCSSSVISKSSGTAFSLPSSDIGSIFLENTGESSGMSASEGAEIIPFKNCFYSSIFLAILVLFN